MADDNDLSSYSNDDEFDDEIDEVLFAVAAYVTLQISRKSSHAVHRPLGGREYIDENLATNHPRRVHEVFRMSKVAFGALCEWAKQNELLKDTANVSVEEQFAILLHITGQKASNRATQEVFQHSGETISAYFHHVLNALCKLHKEVVLPPTGIMPQYISSNPKLYPYFKGCLGALDGSHIPIKVAAKEGIVYRNQKGRVTTNVLAACTFDMRFSYVLAGWEGSAHDSKVLDDAFNNGGFSVPERCFYLGDASYELSRQVLIPYRGTRYHLNKEQASHSYPRFASY